MKIVKTTFEFNRKPMASTSLEYNNKFSITSNPLRPTRDKQNRQHNIEMEGAMYLVAEEETT